MQNISPFLWFDSNAEEAIEFYFSVFKDSRLISSSRYGEHGPGVPGTLMAASFELNGTRFNCLNGGPMFKFTPAISFLIDCKDQEEVDYYWNKLIDGGKPNQCGWLDDRFGLSWQVVPTILNKLLSDPNPVKAGNVMQAMLKMIKIDINLLLEAYNKE